MHKKTALFPGSFDPITLGHEALVIRALGLFDEILIGVGKNSTKQYMFSLEQRMQWIRDTFKDYPQVKVEAYDGLTVNFCSEKKIPFILRGLRNSTDFNFERNIAQMNKAIHREVETVFIITDPDLSAITSTIVREIIREKGDVKQFIPSAVKF